MKKYKVIVCAILQDETPYLNEWVEYHLGIGIEHFVLYDNNSAIPVKDTLAKYVKTGEVEVIDCPITCSPHLKVYNHCLYQVHDNVEWIAFIDGDEFIVMHQHTHIYDLLKTYRRWGGVCLNWVFYTANGHITKPEGLVRDVYTEHLPYDLGINRHVKTIIQPNYTLVMTNPHFAWHDMGRTAVNEHNVKVEGPFSDFSNDIAQISHYFTKSFDEWLVKIDKGDSSTIYHRRRVEEFWNYNPNMLHLREDTEKKYKTWIEEYNKRSEMYFW